MKSLCFFFERRNKWEFLEGFGRFFFISLKMVGFKKI